MNDSRVIQGIRNKDSQMISRVMDKYARLLWSIASAVLQNAGSEQDVEECVADAFIYLWEHPDRFEPTRGSLKTLLCVVARSRAIDRFREINRRKTVSLEEAVLYQGLGIQEELLLWETKQELLAAVRTLGEPGREILIRRYFYDQKPKQIALAMDMTVKQVDNSLYRSKQLLRSRLTAGGAE